MAADVNPATMGGARIVAKAGKLATPSIPKNGARVIFEGPDGPRVVLLKGRLLWALRELVNAGPSGVTPIEHVGPRWSDYVFRLRGEGLDIETVREKHGGEFPGHHGRYVLHSPVVSGGGA